MKGEIDGLGRESGLNIQSMEHRDPAISETGSYETFFVQIGRFVMLRWPIC